ncbi:MAG TPA: hypothetical protein VJ718_11030 [Candidatus Binataceae bacterium]|nr:hypothetical protein [Candidatus Binataceae bacterium]
MIRALRLAAAIVPPALLAIALALPDRATVYAQLPPPNPLTAPRALPTAPAQLAAPVQPQGLPSLVVVQPLPTATPSPSARAFNCSCYGPGSATNWTGEVIATGYFGARQSAASECLAFNERREPPAPVLPPFNAAQALAGVSGLPTVPLGQSSDAASLLMNGRPGALNFAAPQQIQMCSVCTCG